MGVDEEGLIICPTEVFAGASSVTATASPSEALRFFLDFFSVDLERMDGIMYWNTKVWVRCVMRWRYRTHLDIPRSRNSPSSNQELPEHSPDPPISFKYQKFDGYPAIIPVGTTRRRFDTTVPGAERGTRNAERNDHAISRDGAMVDATRRTVTVGVVATARRKFPTATCTPCLSNSCLLRTCA